MKSPEKMPAPEKIFTEEKNDYYESIVIEGEKEKEAPIKEGEVFNPATVKDILKLPSQDRRAALETYKEKLAYQKEGLAEMQQDLTKAIYENSNIKRAELFEIVDEYAEKYGFIPEQLEAIEYALDKYKEKRREVSKFLREYPDAKECFKELFGAGPKGEVEIIEGPITIYFRCHDPDDFARIYNQRIFSKKGDNYELTAKERAKADLSGGVSILSSRIKELEGTIIAENARGREFDKGSRSIYAHEEQHAIKNLLVREEQDRGFMRALEEAGDTSKEKKAALEVSFKSYLEERRRVCEDYAKDEILAFLKGGHRSINSIIEILERNREAGGLYDYFGEDEELVLGKDVREFSEYVSYDKEETRKIAKEAVERVYNKGDFNQTVRKGITAFVDLYRMYDGKKKDSYFKERIIALLINEPLHKWPIVARRLMEQKDRGKPN